MTTIGQPQGNYISDAGGEIFQNAKKLFVKQEKTFCSIEAKQRYRISQATDDNKEGTVFLYITEESQCLERNCCSANRSLKLLVHEGATKEGRVLQTMEKPFSCNICPCFCRPSFDVKAGATQLGYVEDPCRCCWMDQHIKNANGDTLYTTSGSPCQCGMCCPCCAGVHFDVKRQDNKIGAIEKLPMDCSEWWFETNRFVIDMENTRDPLERRLLLSSAMLLDLAYFEEDK